MTKTPRLPLDAVVMPNDDWRWGRRLRDRAVLVSVVLLGVAVGYPEQTRATPLYVANFEAMLDSGFGGLPPTLLGVTYVFENRPPFLVVPHEAYYGFLWVANS